MTNDEKVEKMITMMNDIALDEETAIVYLDLAKEKLLNHIYPFERKTNEVPCRYDYQHIELAIALYNLQGVEGQSSHSENGVSRSYRSTEEILRAIPKHAGFPL